jgi:hypothetical protein
LTEGVYSSCLPAENDSHRTVRKGDLMKRFVMLLFMSMVVIALSQASAAPTAQAANTGGGSTFSIPVEHGPQEFEGMCEEDL